MAENPRVEQLLDEILDSERSPEEVCVSCPELLPEVRRRWQEMCGVEAEFAALFPATERVAGAGPTAGSPPHTNLPPIPGYEVEAVLGRGGMGVVYRARHLRLNRPVALKMLLAGNCAGPSDRARFQREAEAVANLRHANIVQVYDVGEQDGRPFFTMEIVPGGSLAEKLAGVPQPAREAAALVVTLSEAVSAAHQGGIVHRDLKPANVLLSADGTPKISDFGLARRLESAERLTQSGAVLGTPSYMAPEQARGRTRALGPPVDIYALGAILYELLTGRPPFQGETAADTVLQVMSQEPVPPARLNPRVPRDLETICLKCLHKEPPRRYASAAALAEDLRCFLRGEAIAARPEGRLAWLARRVRRRPGLSAALAASTLFAVALVGGGVWEMSERAAAKQRMEAEQEATERAAAEDLRDMVRLQQTLTWPQARAALERAKGRLGEGGSAELRRRLDQGARDLALAARLDDIRLDGSGGNWGALARQRFDEKYAKAFRDAGLGQVHDSPDIVAARIRASHIRNALVAALDHWSEITPAPDRSAWVLEVARQADPDPTGWRVRARTPAVRNDPAALAELVATAPIDEPVALLLALDHHMDPASPERVRFLRRLRQAHPGDFWVNLRLGDALMRTKKPGEAVGCYQAAQAIRPKAAIACNNFGGALLATGRKEEALEQHRQAVLADPTNGNFHYNLAIALLLLDRPDEAVASLRRAIALDPKDAGAQELLRDTLVRQGRTEEARLAWRAALEADPPDHAAWDGYAELCLFLGQEDEYRRARQSLLAKFAASTDPRVAERTARACLLLPATEDELRQAIALAGRAAGVDRTKYQKAYVHFLFVQGLADYRQGHFDPAITAMRGEAGRVLGPAPRLVLAMALHQSGQAEAARKTLAAAVVAHDWRPNKVRDRDGWIYHILRREAERLILPNLPAFLDGTYEPRDNAERLALLGVCQFTSRARAAAGLYADAFAADPRLAEDLRLGLRFSAARAAALAGCGRGEDGATLSQEERTRWRKQARDWLALDLAAWTRKVEAGTAADHVQVKNILTQWQAEPDLAGLREPALLDGMSPDEREEWVALWKEVNALLIRAGQIK
jgi:serine/threonine-protein kinase